MRKRKYTRGIPKFAYGGQVGDEILDFQRQYNPFLGDLPTYGMVGSQQPGAWMFFDDAWLRSGIPQPPPSAVVAPPSPPVMGDTYEGPDGGGADRYQDDWRGYGYGVTPTDFLGTAADYSNLESFAGYNTPGERVIDGPTALIGQAAGFGPVEFADEVGMMADRAAEELALGERAMTRAHEFDEPAAPTGYSRAGTGTQEISGRAWAGNRDRVDEFGPGYGVYNDLTPASNTGYAPADEDYTPAAPYSERGPVQFAAPLDYTADYLTAEDLGKLNAEPPGVSISVDPTAVGQTIGQNMTGEQMYALSEQVQGMLGGQISKDGLSGVAGFAGSPVGQAGAAALSGLMGNAPAVAAPFGEQPTRGFENRSAMSGMSAMAGKGSSGPVGIGGLAAPGTPAGGALASLSELYGLSQDLSFGATPAQPQEPTNAVAGPATPGAPVGISAPAMDPLAGLTDQQIEALAAGYHDQAPAVGVASPVAGFETALAAAQAAAERASEGKGGKAVGAGSSGGVNAGRGMPGAEYTGSSGTVGDKQGPTGEMGGNTGDNSGSGPTGNDTFGGTDSSGNNSDGGSGTDGGMGDDSGASGTSGGSGDEGGMGAWKAGGRVKSRGLPSMADQVAQAGRGNDTVLAHITPDEAARLDAAMGGPSINPETGLREYGFFDDIGDFLGDAAKAVAPIAGGVLGGMFGGPLGAAAGAALGTTLVGGNLQEALLSGGVAGIGAYAAPKMAGGAEGLFGGGDEAATLGGGGTDAGVGQGSGGGFLSGIMGNPLAMVGLGAAGGLGAGYMMGDNDTPSTPATQAPAPWVPRQGGLAQRNYRPYEGNYSTYGQVGGGAGHQFYDQVNPGVVYYAEGGSVEAPSKEKMRETLGRELLSGNDMTSPVSVLQIAQMAMPPRPAQQPGLPAPQLQEPQQLQQPMPPTGQGMMGQWQQQVMPPWLIDRDDASDDRVANLIWRAPGGEVSGPGHGQSDSIPAMLSDGEYVVSADVVSQLGGGSNNAGADRLDQMMANVRHHRSQGGKGLPPMAKSPMEYMGR